MSKLSALFGILVLSLSFEVLAQTATLTQNTATTTPATVNMCVERGLKCCFKARGKRAEKIKTKCEKKYKCTCPATTKPQ